MKLKIPSVQCQRTSHRSLSKSQLNKPLSKCLSQQPFLSSRLVFSQQISERPMSELPSVKKTIPSVKCQSQEPFLRKMPFFLFRASICSTPSYLSELGQENHSQSPPSPSQLRFQRLSPPFFFSPSPSGYAAAGNAQPPLAGPQASVNRYSCTFIYMTLFLLFYSSYYLLCMVGWVLSKLRQRTTNKRTIFME